MRNVSAPWRICVTVKGPRQNDKLEECRAVLAVLTISGRRLGKFNDGHVSEFPNFPKS